MREVLQIGLSQEYEEILHHLLESLENFPSRGPVLNTEM
jgi:hypothetical protein